ncbi:MAG: 16S rRNA (cytosine(1402)-N(4))-methyltransferase RsmH [Gammaproteobacteria bacterium]
MHVPVLLSEVVELMNVQPAGTYLDATFGRGGHTRALLAALGPAGRVIACDRDAEAVAAGGELAHEDPRLSVHHAPFSAIGEIAGEVRGAVDGILFDFGLSSPQLDAPGRGFSFREDGPLDMRMDRDQGLTAADWLAQADERTIADVLWRYGEERRSRQIARRIVERRVTEPLETTAELAALVRSCMRGGHQRIDPATRTFQALRIVVNDELGEIERALEAALALLARGGRLLTIAFHSLEDRIVKRRFRDLDAERRDAERDGQALAPAFRVLTKRPVMASEEEKRSNPRARSARLRALERVA